MVNKKIALMIGLLFTTAAVQADYTVEDTVEDYITGSVEAVIVECRALPAEYRALTTEQKDMVIAYLLLHYVVIQPDTLMGAAKNLHYINN